MVEDTVQIEVDSRKLVARKGQALIEVADQNNIYIPRFCYHEKLSIAANCRMCLVEVEKIPKLLPACATMVMDGMVVRTRSALVKEAQQSIMEFLLINHPLDCPICDQGGECELQDLAVDYGHAVSRYQEKKRVVADKNMGPLIQTDMTRCIHCTRCVRFGEEIAGLQEMGAIGRGEHMEIGTYITKTLRSELSGNIIDLCPVGALTSKPFRFSARSWELVQKRSISAHDSVGSNIYVHVKDNQVKRVVPARNEEINETWLSDRDRFSYQGIYSDDRLLTPCIKINGQWQDVAWEGALDFTYDRLAKMIDHHGVDKIGALASPSSTLEELYLFQKLLRELGCHNIDHRYRQRDFSDQHIAPAFPYLGQTVREIELLEAVLLVGTNVRKEQPIINHRLSKASKKGCKIMSVNPIAYEFNYDLQQERVVAPTEMAQELAAIIKAVDAKSTDAALKKILHKASVSAAHEAIANTLKKHDKSSILLGNIAMAHPAFSLLRGLAVYLAQITSSSLGYLSEASNSSGAWLAGALPHRLPGAKASMQVGLDAYAMLQKGCNAYIIMGFEPELDAWDANLASKALQAADLVIALTAYRSDAMVEYADILLPMASFVETAGTYINNAGMQQTFSAATKPSGQARPGWKILRVLANQFSLMGFNYNGVSEILDEVNPLFDGVKLDTNTQWQFAVENEAVSGALQRISDIPMNSVDSITRRSSALQMTADVADGAAHINRHTAAQLHITNGEQVQIKQDGRYLLLPAVLDERVPDQCVLIHAAQLPHRELGPAFGTIQLNKC